MGTRKKRQNPFITFMGTFRKQNKGKYDFKQMGREAGKAWHKVKGGGNECSALTNANEKQKCEETKIVTDQGNAWFGGRHRRRTQKRRRR